MAAYSPETDSEDELPPGWEERATLEGVVFYANHHSKSTQWTHPRTGKRKKVSENLPYGWERKILPDNKIVYVDHENKKTTYSDPRLAFAVEVQEDGTTGLENFRQRFDASSKALQVLHGQDLSGQLAVVTGANSGIGYEIARTLGRCGCAVVFACRDLAKAEVAIGKLRAERPLAKCQAMHLDLSSLASIKRFADNFNSRFVNSDNLTGLDYLILNAGVLGLPFGLTEDGFDTTFQVNYLGHFYLANLLRPQLVKSRLPKGAKIVSVSAECHRFSSLDSPDMFTSETLLSPTSDRAFNSTVANNDSKLCCLMFSMEADSKWNHYECGKNTIRSIAVHPGNMISSGLPRNWWLYQVMFSLVRPFCKSLQQGASSAVFAAASPEMSSASGIYINNCFPCQPSSICRNIEARQNLWRTSKAMLKAKGHCC